MNSWSMESLLDHYGDELGWILIQFDPRACNLNGPPINPPTPQNYPPPQHHHNTTSTLVLFNADRPCQLLHGPPHGRPMPQWLSTAQQRKKKDLLARGLRPPTPAVPVLAFPEEISKSWGGWRVVWGCGGGGGRIVAASEMLRPSVEHFQQAEVMPRSCKK